MMGRPRKVGGKEKVMLALSEGLAEWESDIRADERARLLVEINKAVKKK